MDDMLKGRRINLRTVKRKDLDQYLEFSSDIETRGNFFPLALKTETSIRSRFEKDGFWSEESGLMFIVDNLDDRILGMITFFKPVHYYDAVELGYIVYDSRDRGKGFMPEAVLLFSAYLFAWKPIYRIQLQIQPGNLASRRVAEKCGFKHEGTARQAIIANGTPVDIDVYSLLRSEILSE
jgi:RimJ/RimL family protein N-acetyltransferase